MKLDDKSIIIENTPEVMIVGSRKYIRDKVIPEILAEFKKQKGLNIKVKLGLS